MSLRRLLVIGLGICAAVLAYFLRDAINDNLIVPAAYLWWRIEIYFKTFPEDIWFRLAAVIVSLIAYATLFGGNQSSSDDARRDVQLLPGPVEELNVWLRQSRHRSYYRRLVARKLARLAQAFFLQRDKKNEGALKRLDWDPSIAVESYFRYGLKGSLGPGGYTEHEANLLSTVEYLEKEIGDRDDAN